MELTLDQARTKLKDIEKKEQDLTNEKSSITGSIETLKTQLLDMLQVKTIDEAEKLLEEKEKELGTLGTQLQSILKEIELATSEKGII